MNYLIDKLEQKRALCNRKKKRESNIWNSSSYRSWHVLSDVIDDGEHYYYLIILCTIPTCVLLSPSVKIWL